MLGVLNTASDIGKCLITGSYWLLKIIKISPKLCFNSDTQPRIHNIIKLIFISYFLLLAKYVNMTNLKYFNIYFGLVGTYILINLMLTSKSYHTLKVVKVNEYEQYQ